MSVLLMKSQGAPAGDKTEYFRRLLLGHLSSLEAGENLKKAIDDLSLLMKARPKFASQKCGATPAIAAIKSEK
jgi:hypothetical protein